MTFKNAVKKFISVVLSVFLLCPINIYAYSDSAIVQKNINSINILVDPRLELISAVQIISGEYDFMLTQYDFKYKEDIKNYFEKYKNHKVVKLFLELIEDGFDGSAIPNACLYLSEDGDLNPEIVLPEELIERIGEEEKVYAFLNELKNFSDESNFDEFYKTHKPYYKKLVDENSKLLENKNYIKQVEDYYGMKNNTYNIILSPIFWNGGFNATVEKEANKRDVVSILGTRNLNGDISYFGDEKQFEDICMHEFSHSFVNMITENNIDEVNKYNSLLEPIIKKMDIFGGYSSWDISVNEHIIRAVVIRLNALKESSELYQKSILEQKEMGFYYIEPIIEKLEYYEANRNKYKTFEQFYPEIIKVFKDLSLQELTKDFYTNSFSGNLNSILFMDKPIAAILPTNGLDKDLQYEVEENFKKISESLKEFYPTEIDIMTDEEAVKADLTNKNIILMGTSDNNKWFEKYYVDMNVPIKFETNKIMTDKTYEGENLKLMIAIESPFGNNGIMLLISQKLEDFPLLSWYGNDNYGIWEGDKKIKSGSYYFDSSNNLNYR